MWSSLLCLSLVLLLWGTPGNGMAVGTWAAGTWAAGTLHLQPGSRESGMVMLRSLFMISLFRYLHTHKVGAGRQNLRRLTGRHTPLASLMRYDSNWACSSSRSYSLERCCHSCSGFPPQFTNLEMPNRHTQRLACQVILDPVKLKTTISHHTPMPSSFFFSIVHEYCILSECFLSSIANYHVGFHIEKLSVY